MRKRRISAAAAAAAAAATIADDVTAAMNNSTVVIMDEEEVVVVTTVSAGNNNNRRITGHHHHHHHQDEQQRRQQLVVLPPPPPPPPPTCGSRSLLIPPHQQRRQRQRHRLLKKTTKATSNTSRTSRGSLVMMISLWLLLIILPQPGLSSNATVEESNANANNKPSLGIPGTTQTQSGYDTEMGIDPICWESTGGTYHNHDPNVMLFDNDLIKEFRLDDSVKLLSNCPFSNNLKGRPPITGMTNSDGGSSGGERRRRLRTGMWYNYTLDISLNVETMGGTQFVSDLPHNHRVSLQVIVCTLGVSGFCSPFIHDESNARLQAQGIYETPDDGESHGGTHVHSPRVFRTLNPEDGPQYNLTNVTVPMLVNVPGQYFTIVAVQMFVKNGTTASTDDYDFDGEKLIRYDMANSLEYDKILHYEEPPTILEVSMAVQVVTWVGIGITASIILFLLYQTIKYRDHQVLQLTQGPFLIVFLIAALVATICSFLLEPENDIYCKYGDSLILMSLQLFFAITIGRLWRINAVISPLLMQTINKRHGRRHKNWKTHLTNWIRTSSSIASKLGDLSESKRNSMNVTNNNNNDRSNGRAKTLRKQVTSTHLAVVVALFTLPQVIICVLAMTLQPETLTILYNDDESVGRKICTNGLPIGQSLIMYGAYMFLLLIVVLVILAYATNGLPSLFNETKIIYDSTLTTILLLILGLGVIFVTRGPTTSPSVEYFIMVLLVLSIALNMSLRIMLPKLRMVWRNETVLVSKLVSDHARSARASTAKSGGGGDGSSSSPTYDPRISGLHPPPGWRGSSSNYNNNDNDNKQHPPAAAHRQRVYRESSGARNSNSMEVLDDLENFHNDSTQEQDEEQYNNKTSKTDTETTDQDVTEGSESHQHSTTAGNVNSTVRNRRMRELASSLPSQRRVNGMISQRILVTQNETPARRLVLKMVDLQEHLAEVNERIITGLAVSEEDWELLRRLSGKLGDAFREEVKFDWEASHHEDSITLTTNNNNNNNSSRNRIGGGSSGVLSIPEDAVVSEPAAAAAAIVNNDNSNTNLVGEQWRDEESNNYSGSIDHDLLLVQQDSGDDESIEDDGVIEVGGGIIKL